MFKLLKYLKKYWYFAILAPLFMIFEVGMDMLITAQMGEIIDLGIYQKDVDAIINHGLIMLIYVLIGVVCGFLSGVFANLAANNFSNDLRKDLFKKIMSLSYNQTDKFSTGSLITRVTNDVTQIQNFVAQMIRMFVRSFGMFALGIIFTIRIDKVFSIIILIALPLEIIIMLIFLKKTFPHFKIMQEKTDKINTLLHENLTGARVVKAFGKEEYESERFAKVNDSLCDTLLYINKMFSVLIPAFMLIVYLAQLAIYAITGNSYAEGFANLTAPKITVGMNTEATTYITMICFSLIQLGMVFMNVSRSIASSNRILEVFNTKDEIIDGNLDINDLKEEGTIEFKNMSFTYPLASAPSLIDINLKINKGDTIAIVGATGAGKTTLVNLICRFYDVSDGEILVDGINVKDFKQVDLRNKIAIALQKSELFAGSIKDNISWGKLDASDDEIKEAAKISQAEEFILNCPNQYDEYVEEKGTSLSGGQKQRISIARAIIKKPEILIFDDSTSALDLITEAKLYQAMKEKIGNITKIVVAQRIATAKNADKIVVLDYGKIIAFDTHENLLKNCEVYQDIYNSQLKKEGVFDEN